MKTWMEEYSAVEDISIDDICFISNDSVCEVRIIDSLEVQTVPVDHCIDSYAAVMSIHGFKFTFSGYFML
jgi:hypothetical protein